MPPNVTGTACPGWSVHDQVSHVVGLELDLAERGDGELPLPDLPHLTEGNRAMEHSVEKRRTWSTSRLLTEFDEIAATRMTALRALLAAPGYDPSAVARGPFGWQLPLRALLGLRVFDIYAHSQDIRRAIGAPGGLERPAFDVSRQRIVRGLAAALPVKLPELAGTTIAITVTGAPVSDPTMTIDFRGAKARVSAGDPEEEVTVTLTIEAGNLIALGCGRADADPAAVGISGDEELGVSVLAHFGVTP